MQCDLFSATLLTNEIATGGNSFGEALTVKCYHSAPRMIKDLNFYDSRAFVMCSTLYFTMIAFSSRNCSNFRRNKKGSIQLFTSGTIGSLSFPFSFQTESHLIVIKATKESLS